MVEFFEIIGNQAFPIVISAYLLIKLEKRMDDMTDAIKELIIAIEKK